MNNSSTLKTILCLMGPTASGKTPLAIELVKHFPCEIISVDSAMVYKGMDVGTAKPTTAELISAPHRLINLIDPAESYSAGQFRVDALNEIEKIHASGKIPLLVGGTMLYFRVLHQGIASLPRANAKLREALSELALNKGLAYLHAELAKLDPVAAKRIHKNDSQRIQRALEVYQLTGKTITALQAQETNPLSGYDVYHLALSPSDRALLHARIARRFKYMLELGFENEVSALYARGDLSRNLSSIRSVGYQQMWAYLAGESSYEHMCEKVVFATRQLAKRQLTWLRSWPDLKWFDSERSDIVGEVLSYLKNILQLKD